MGFKVGMPTLELKMGATAASKNAKRFGNGRSICVEAGVERYSKTQNFDPSRSHLNAHLGRYENGDEAWDYIKGQVDSIEAERKAQGKRGIRKDATVAHALIVKPDGDWVNAQKPEDVERFFDDAAEVLDELGIVPKDSVVMRERHLDEGISDDEPCAHEHYVFMARTADGDLAGSRHLRLKEFKKLNRDFPRMMRARGWDCEELVGYDSEAARNMSENERAEYKKQHIEKKQEYGLSANEYIARKKAERIAAAAESRQKLAEQKAAAAVEELAEMEPKLTAGRVEIASLDADKKKAEDEKRKAQAEADAAKKERKAAFDEKLKMGRELTQVKTHVERRKAELDELDETIESRTEAVAARERAAARKEAEAAQKLKTAQDLAQRAQMTLDTAEKEAEGAFSFMRNFLEIKLRKKSPGFLDKMLTWVNDAQRAYAQWTADASGSAETVRRNVDLAQLRMNQKSNDGIDF